MQTAEKRFTLAALTLFFKFYFSIMIGTINVTRHLMGSKHVGMKYARIVARPCFEIILKINTHEDLKIVFRICSKHGPGDRYAFVHRSCFQKRQR